MKVKRFKLLANIVIKIAELPEEQVSWETKYDLIFSDEISMQIWDTGVRLEYADPDMDYDDGVIAFVNALKYKLKEL